MEQILQWIVLVLGIGSVGMAVYYWRFFNRNTQRRSLAATMRAFLIEQLITSVGTLLFSVSSIYRMLSGSEEAVWNSVPPLMAQCIRIAMFVAMLHSTVRLSVEVSRVIREEGRGG